MFWIHSGCNGNRQSIFHNGTANVQHSLVMDFPVIYVGIIYRLGACGFLTSPELNAVGLSCFGLNNQYLVLQGVHNNIKALGGDLSKVMIFGESAGAAGCWPNCLTHR